MTPKSGKADKGDVQKLQTGPSAGAGSDAMQALRDQMSHKDRQISSLAGQLKKSRIVPEYPKRLGRDGKGDGKRSKSSGSGGK